jgi:hypothetical protein
MIVKLIIDRIEKDKAVLITKDNESIVWPVSKLPKNATEGAEFQFNIVDAKGGDKDLAKDLLNEILDA